MLAPRLPKLASYIKLSAPIFLRLCKNRMKFQFLRYSIPGTLYETYIQLHCFDMSTITVGHECNKISTSKSIGNQIAKRFRK